jgi:hypothetical protein
VDRYKNLLKKNMETIDMPQERRDGYIELSGKIDTLVISVTEVLTNQKNMRKWIEEHDEVINEIVHDMDYFKGAIKTGAIVGSVMFAVATLVIMIIAI